QEQIRYLLIGDEGHAMKCEAFLENPRMRVMVADHWDRGEMFFGNMNQSERFRRIQGPPEKWSFEGMDIVTVDMALQFENPKQFIPALQQMFNVLAPGGLCNLTVVVKEPSLPEAVQTLFRQAGFWLAPDDAHLLRDTFEQIGFQILGHLRDSEAIKFS